LEAEFEMKIAVISDDGKSVSMHFGRAQLYVVVEVEGGKVVNREIRTKVGHHTFGDQPHAEHQGAAHGYDADSQNKHSQMAANISDCQVLLAGGMGRGAHDSLKGYGIEPIITDIEDIDQAVRAYADGTIRNLSERLH
jgi:predicted Fe-Mo cluster-binding NifX family protein